MKKCEQKYSTYTSTETCGFCDEPRSAHSEPEGLDEAYSDYMDKMIKGEFDTAVDRTDRVFLTTEYFDKKHDEGKVEWWLLPSSSIQHFLQDWCGTEWLKHWLEAREAYLDDALEAAALGAADAMIWLDADPAHIVAVQQFGNTKYKAWSWLEVPNAVERYWSAGCRHAHAALVEANDKDSGLPHLWHLECNMAFFMELVERAR